MASHSAGHGRLWGSDWCPVTPDPTPACSATSSTSPLMADRAISTGLPAVRFSAERRAHAESLCDDLIERALDEHHAFHAAENSSRWKSVRQKDALTVYRVLGSRPNGRTGSKSSQLVCSGLLAGTVENALNGVYCDTTETLHLVKSILSDKFLDGRVVHVLENNSMDAPIIFTGIKWFATKSPGGNLIHDRDLLTFERMGRIVDRQGNYFVYHVVQSIELPEWPANRQQHLQRAYISLCYLYRQVNKDWVGCFMLGDLDPHGSVHHAISDFVAADVMLSVRNVMDCAYAKAFSALVADNADVMPSMNKACDICMHVPHMLGDNHKSCAGCHRRVCKKCRDRRTVFRLHLRTKKPETEIFCHACIESVALAVPKVLPSISPPDEFDPGASNIFARSGSWVVKTPSSNTVGSSPASSSGGRNWRRSDHASVPILGLSDADQPAFAWNRQELAQLSSYLRTTEQKRRTERSQSVAKRPVDEKTKSRRYSVRVMSADDIPDTTRSRAATSATTTLTSSTTSRPLPLPPRASTYSSTRAHTSDMDALYAAFQDALGPNRKDPVLGNKVEISHNLENMRHQAQFVRIEEVD